MLIEFWPRTHQAHISRKDIHQLRQFVELISSQKPANPRDSRVIPAGRATPTLRAQKHRSKFPYAKGLSIPAGAHSAIEDGAVGIQFDRQRNQQQQRGNQHQSESGKKQINRPLDRFFKWPHALRQLFPYLGFENGTAHRPSGIACALIPCLDSECMASSLYCGEALLDIPETELRTAWRSCRFCVTGCRIDSPGVRDSLATEINMLSNRSARVAMSNRSRAQRIPFLPISARCSAVISSNLRIAAAKAGGSCGGTTMPH